MPSRDTSEICAYYRELVILILNNSDYFLNIFPKIFSGKQLYSEKYKDTEKLKLLDLDRPPKWNFTDFVFSFLMVSTIAVLRSVIFCFVF